MSCSSVRTLKINSLRNLILDFLPLRDAAVVNCVMKLWNSQEGEVGKVAAKAGARQFYPGYLAGKIHITSLKEFQKLMLASQFVYKQPLFDLMRSCQSLILPHTGDSKLASQILLNVRNMTMNHPQFCTRIRSLAFQSDLLKGHEMGSFVMASDPQYSWDIQDVDFHSFCRFTSLSTLIFQSCHSISDSAIRHLPLTLTTLEFCDCSKLTEQGVEELARLKSLQHLSLLSMMSIGPDDLTIRCLAPLQTLRGLELICREPLTDAGMEHLASFTALERLWIDAGKLTDAGLVKLSCFDSLQRVILMAGVNITDKGIAHFAKFKSLERFTITHSEHMTDQAIGSLAGLPSLSYVDVLGCPGITNAGWAEIHMRWNIPLHRSVDVPYSSTTPSVREIVRALNYTNPRSPLGQFLQAALKRGRNEKKLFQTLSQADKAMIWECAGQGQSGNPKERKKWGKAHFFDKGVDRARIVREMISCKTDRFADSTVFGQYAAHLTRGTPNDIFQEAIGENRIYLTTVTENPCLLADIFDYIEKEHKDAKEPMFNVEVL